MAKFLLPKETNNQAENILSDSLRLPSLSKSFPPDVQQSHQQMMFDPLVGNIDPELQERIEECKRQNSTLPLTKEIMKYKILERRAQLGLGEINITFDGERSFPLTTEEEEKRNRRREQNKKAAARCRDRRKLRDRFLTREFGEELEKNALLRESLKKLKVEKNDLVTQLINHGRTCPILAHTEQMPAYNITKSSQNYDNDNNGFCDTFPTAKSIPTSGNSALDFQPVAKAEDDDARTLSPLSSDKPCTVSQSPNDMTLTKADDHSHVASSTLTSVGASNKDVPLDIISFPFPSPSPSPSFPFDSSSTPAFTFPSSSFPSSSFPCSPFPFSPSSTLPLSSANFSPPSPVILSSDSFYSSFPAETPLHHSPLPIPFPQSATRLPPSSNLPVHLSPLSPQASSFSSSSHFSPSSPFSFSSSFSFSPSSSSFTSSFSSVPSDCSLSSILGSGEANNQTSNSRTNDNFFDIASFIPNLDLYNPSNDLTLTNLHTPLTASQNEAASLFATEAPHTDTQHVQRPDSGENCDSLLQFPLQLSLEPYEHISVIPRTL